MLLGRAQGMTRIETYNSQRTHKKSFTGKTNLLRRGKVGVTFFNPAVLLRQQNPVLSLLPTLPY